MSSSGHSPHPLSPNDALPPVEPPSPGFILQLFIVPAIIVLIIVSVWLMFNWLAQKGNDPQAYLQALERNNEARWQAAVNLASALSDRGPEANQLKNDSAFATRLAKILANELKTGGLQERPIMLRMYLARALGEFHVPAGLDVLVETVRASRDEKETPVRIAALQAIAVLSENVRQASGEHLSHPKLDETLLQAASDSDPLVRSAAAYAMGVVGSETLLARLEAMLEDNYPDVRYNAATGLARHGNAAAQQVLVEMLDPEELAGVRIEKEEGSREYKRAMIMINALRAAEKLAAQSSAELDPLRGAVAKLLEAELDPQLRVKATEVLNRLQEHAAAEPAKS